MWAAEGSNLARVMFEPLFDGCLRRHWRRGSGPSELGPRMALGHVECSGASLLRWCARSERLQDEALTFMIRRSVCLSVSSAHVLVGACGRLQRVSMCECGLWSASMLSCECERVCTVTDLVVSDPPRAPHPSAPPVCKT